jgi:hypothetical protein
VQLEVSRRVHDRADRRRPISSGCRGLVQRGKTLEGRRHDLLTGGHRHQGLLFAVPRPVPIHLVPMHLGGPPLRGRLCVGGACQMRIPEALGRRRPPDRRRERRPNWRGRPHTRRRGGSTRRRQDERQLVAQIRQQVVCRPPKPDVRLSKLEIRIHRWRGNSPMAMVHFRWTRSASRLAPHVPHWSPSN